MNLKSNQLITMLASLISPNEMTRTSSSTTSGLTVKKCVCLTGQCQAMYQNVYFEFTRNLHSGI